MIRTILIDDERLALDELNYLLSKQFSQEIQIIGMADTAQEALNLVSKEKPDLIFLDIQMRGFTGLELADMIHNISPHSQIIFATAYDEYALKAFELEAADYIMKPIEDARLALAIEHAKKKLHLPAVSNNASSNPSRSRAETNADNTAKGTSSGANTDVGVLIDTGSGSGSGVGAGVGAISDLGATGHPSPCPDAHLHMHKIPVDHQGRILLLPIKDITYISSDTGSVEIHTRKAIYNSNKTLTELQDKLAQDAFYRIHRSYIVNLQEITEVVPWFKGTYWVKVPDMVKDGKPTLTSLPISKSQVKIVKEYLGLS
ncbi:MAG: response regulator transcription factor [Veillonella sp.]|nr:response regulator transcription factor [Veillonella sp.]